MAKKAAKRHYSKSSENDVKKEDRRYKKESQKVDMATWAGR